MRFLMSGPVCCCVFVPDGHICTIIGICTRAIRVHFTYFTGISIQKPSAWTNCRINKTRTRDTKHYVFQNVIIKKVKYTPHAFCDV